MIVNFLAFQAGWFAAVLSAAAGRPWVGMLIMAATIGLHLWSSAAPRRELLLILFCGVLGGAWDSVLVAMGWVGYDAGVVVPFLAPYWIVAMWMIFATTLNSSLSWLKGRDALAAAFGAAGGPLAYLTGQKLGGIELIDTYAACVALAVGWAVMMPLLLRVADRLDGVGRTAPRDVWIVG